MTPHGPFTLASAARFIAGWEAADTAAAGEGVVRLGFLVDDWSGSAGVALRQDADGTLRGALTGDGSLERAWAQALRVVSLDHDGTGYADVGARDAVIGRLQEQSGFLRPVLFHSPYEAACWGVISARLRSAQAREIRSRLSEEVGGAVEVAGERMVTFPAPERLLSLTEWPSLPDEKLRRLHGIAEAALAGALEREALLAAGQEEAVARLRELRGIGPFWADGIWLRAGGPTDGLTLNESRVRVTAARLYDRPEVTEDDAAFTALAAAWRPYRTWATVLLRAAG